MFLLVSEISQYKKNDSKHSGYQKRINCGADLQIIHPEYNHEEKATDEKPDACVTSVIKIF